MVVQGSLPATRRQVVPDGDLHCLGVYGRKSMIGRLFNPTDWAAFERQWGSPKGHPQLARRALYEMGRRAGSLELQAKAIGPFGFQPDNNATRAFEYPWAFFAVPVTMSHPVFDLGGSLGWLQFVLSRTGAWVITVDPAESA